MSVRDEREELRERVQKNLSKERFNFDLLNKTKAKTSNAVIKLMLNQLAVDSKKHENMLKIILSLLDPLRTTIDREGDEFQEIIEQHIKFEDDMLKTYEKLIDETEDKRIRFLLQNILVDEEKHHSLIKRIHELVCEGSEITDEQWWDFLFRYSRLTG